MAIISVIGVAIMLIVIGFAIGIWVGRNWERRKHESKEDDEEEAHSDGEEEHDGKKDE